MSPRDYFICIGCGGAKDLPELLYTFHARDFVSVYGVPPNGWDKHVCRTCGIEIYLPQFLRGKAIHQWRKEEAGRRRGDMRAAS